MISALLLLVLTAAAPAVASPAAPAVASPAAPAVASPGAPAVASPAAPAVAWPAVPGGSTLVAVPADPAAAPAEPALVASAPPATGPAFVMAELLAGSSRLEAPGADYLLALAGLDATLPADARAAERTLLRRTARLLAAQRIARLPPPSDVLRLEALLGHPEDHALAARGEAVAVALAAEQAEDGLFGDLRWPLPRRLVRTAEALRALRAATGTPEGEHRAALATLRASRALARDDSTPLDAFTAAALLESRALPAHRVRALRKLVRDGLATDEAGRLHATPAAGALRSDGTQPGALEQTARAALALLPDRFDDAGKLLCFTLAAAWRPDEAWGDETTSWLALRAVVEGLPAR